MKRKKLFLRALALLLCAAALPWPGTGSVLAPRADALEIDIDNTAFSDPRYDTEYMYFWHEGLPPAQGAKKQNGDWLEYPILITWDDKYYLCADSALASGIEKTEGIKYNGKKVATKDHHCFIVHFTIGDGGGFSEEYRETSFDRWDRVWGKTDYYMRTSYSLSENALLAKLPMEADVLLQYGHAVSVKTPVTPNLVLADPENDRYALKLPNSVFGSAAFDYWNLDIMVSPVEDWGETNWLTAGVLSKQWVETSMGYDDNNAGDVMWRLEVDKAYTTRTDPFGTFPTSLTNVANYLDKDFVQHTWISYYDVNKTQSYEKVYLPENRFWTIRKDSAGKYHLWTTGNNAWDRQRITGEGDKDNIQRIRDWSHAMDVARVYLDHQDGKIVVDTPTVKCINWERQRVNTVDNTPAFRIFYAEPNIVSFHRNSFSVKKGQVVNLDGPMVIDSQCTVTVEDGGVLTVSGWLMNNGQILVQPGGTLLVQERNTLTGDRQWGAITSLDTDPDTAAGRISCDGKMIVMRDCKVVGAGTYGLQFGEGAQVVNYGQIISENLSCHMDHTIENRGDTSAVFAGWGVTGSGYTLSRTEITGQDYAGKGTMQKTALVRLPENAVYGEGAERFYVNTAKTVTYEKPRSRKGYTANVPAYVPMREYDLPELPKTVQVYYDPNYEVYFIRSGGMIFTYSEAYARWMYVSSDGSRYTYDYGMPGEGTAYIEAELPGGYMLPNGILVGETIDGELPTAGGLLTMDLKYDSRLEVVWFPGNDGHVYHYEPYLGDYLYVDEEGYFHRYPDQVSPPTVVDGSFYIPGDMYEPMPAGAETRRYEPGMTEWGAWRIYKDYRFDRYFIRVDGLCYCWDASRGWMYTNRNGSVLTYEYAPPSDRQTYESGELPTGYILPDGRLVEPSVNKELLYDSFRELFWFIGEDAHAYYYETRINAYIYVDEAGYYHTYPRIVSVRSDPESIPRDRWESLPSFRYYENGMSAYPSGGASGAGGPEPEGPEASESSGTSPHAAPPEPDRYYDADLGAFWFTAQDGISYYYEPQAGAYVYVDEEGYYHRYPYALEAPNLAPEEIPAQRLEKTPVTRFAGIGTPEFGTQPAGPVLTYDRKLGLYWFTGEDGHAYYYETALGKYIYIDDSRIYYRVCPQEVPAPPADLSPETVPAWYCGNWPSNYVYQSGMREYGAGAAIPTMDPSLPKPKLQYDRGEYYIIYKSKQYIWEPRYGWFLPRSGTGWVNGVPLDGVSPEDVDLNGHTLP